MSYSTIKRKMCKGSCGKMPVLGFGGYCIKCSPKEIKEKKLAKTEKVRKASAKRIATRLRADLAASKGITLKGASEAEIALKAALAIWFADRAKELTGKCANCGEKTSKGDAKYQKYSIAHILPKKPNAFPSVATHPFNFVELCYFGNSCHTNFDNNGFDYASEKMPRLWEIIVKRVNLMYPKIKEKSRLPDIIRQEIIQP